MKIHRNSAIWEDNGNHLEPEENVKIESTCIIKVAIVGCIDIKKNGEKRGNYQREKQGKMPGQKDTLILGV